MINKKKNLPAMILLILGLSAIALPLYMTRSGQKKYIMKKYKQ